MGFFKKKAPALDIGKLLAASLEGVVHKPADQFLPQISPHEDSTRREGQTVTEFLAQNTPLTEDQAHIEVLCYGMAIYDFAIQSAVPAIHHKAIYEGFYPTLELTMRQWTAAESVHDFVKNRVEEYWRAIRKGQLPGTGTPVIVRAFFEVCECGQKDSIKDYLSFTMQTTVLLRLLYETASGIIKEYKIV